jgi:DNA-binding LacI/PurR family transcriptional regulator
VAGFDDILVSSIITPALTTIRQPGFDKGVEAGQVMFAC